MLYHIILITKMFRSLLRSSSVYLYKSTKNTTNCQIMSVEQLNFIKNASNSQYDKNISVCTVKIG